MSLNLKKWQEKCSEIQKTLDEEIMLKEDNIGKIHQIERKVKLADLTSYIIIYLKVQFLKNELDETKLRLAESERKRKLTEEELNDMTENIDDLKSSNEYLSNCKSKLENDINLLSVRINYRIGIKIQRMIFS